jgi:hypothetical protein
MGHDLPPELFETLADAIDRTARSGTAEHARNR